VQEGLLLFTYREKGKENKMWGLPDSAILGTIKSLKSHKGGKKSSAVSKPKVKPITLAQSWDCFDQDSRSFEELLAMARLTIEKRHAE
jgi:hypothetical protein